MRVVYTPAHLRHDPRTEIEQSGWHAPWEHIGRAEAIRAVLTADPTFEVVEPTAWGLDPVGAVHERGLVDFLAGAWAEYQLVNPGTSDVVPDVFYRPGIRRGMTPAVEPASIHGRLGWYCFETTTPLTEGTFEAACAAVDTALSTATIVLDGAPSAYGLCRPPGHHATTANYGGYCFFNNAAIAAHHIAASTGSKVTVLDVDYHHGNGTQEIFYDRADVQYVSLHGDPVRAYPYTIGYADETGTGAGAGTNLNLPLAARTDDDSYLDVLHRACTAIQSFRPDVLVVSLGLDTFITDPICDLALTADGFARSGALVGELGLPTVVLQEGGYDVAALGDNVRQWLLGLHRG
ncbi:MAG: Acetylpolyamine amidohydrolase [Ilumatobacteraceae bacterium]|nr:Acetylpolyamine amidohydrolase [Ilumatobacteraceae bacterium]